MGRALRALHKDTPKSGILPLCFYSASIRPASVKGSLYIPLYSPAGNTSGRCDMHGSFMVFVTLNKTAPERGTSTALSSHPCMWPIKEGLTRRLYFHIVEVSVSVLSNERLPVWEWCCYRTAAAVLHVINLYKCFHVSFNLQRYTVREFYGNIFQFVSDHPQRLSVYLETRGYVLSNNSLIRSQEGNHTPSTKPTSERANVTASYIAGNVISFFHL